MTCPTPEEAAAEILKRRATVPSTQEYQWLKREIASAIRDAVKAENEACAKEVNEIGWDRHATFIDAANTIRNRQRQVTP